MVNLTKEVRAAMVEAAVASTFLSEQRTAIVASAKAALAGMGRTDLLGAILGAAAPELCELLGWQPDNRALARASSPRLSACYAAAKKLRAKEEALRADLHAVLSTCRTYQQVHKTAPYLVRYLPTPPGKAEVPTARLAQALASLGFDRTPAKEVSAAQ